MLAQQDFEARLREMMIRCEDLLSSLLSRDNNADAICQAPIFIGHLSKQSKPAIHSYAVGCNTAPAGRLARGLDQPQRGSFVSHPAEGIANLEQDGIGG